MGDFGGGGGRNVPMSATRVHRLRALAVQKLAEAYKADEIASSVMVMGRGTVFDDIAERVLKVDPKNADARYVHFFHEKIPSRQLAESTSTNTLDQLIAENPQRLEFYRTRGIVHCFRDEFALATKDFTYALRESRAVRRARQAHDPALRSNGDSHSKAKRKKAKVNGQAPPSGTAPVIEGPDGEQLLIHHSVLPDAPEPLEPQVLFHRGAAYLAHAFFLIEEAFFTLEEIPRIPPNDFGEVHLSYVTHGRYGGTEIGNPDGPLGRADGSKARAYRAAFGEGRLREQVCTLLRKSKRDHEKFLAHFDTLELEAPPDAEDYGDGDVLHRMERAFALLETFRPNSRQHDAPALAQDVALPFTTYHPLLLEAHFSILNCLLMLGEFAALTRTFGRAACIVAGLEGYPVFLPPRSMAQAEFVETLERLAGGWRYGRLPNALVRAGAPRFAEPVVRRTPSPLPVAEEDDPVAAACPSAGPSTASSSSKTPSASGRGSPVSDAADTEGGDVRGALEHLRALLAPVHARLRAKAERERAASEQARGAGAENARAPLSLALHGARVEVILAWLGAVHLPALEAAAASP
ncbi:hypothetical protein DFH11DRAFT_1619688 [Phellopilus nigrolimitatus]|nr:hypothetical protein DFH11DRAFT_1619688 [Phellopilus nigrolimitatus]